MLLKRLYDERLAQASYLVGCQATGEALVVDPNRDAEAYLAAARAEGVRITHVTETHIHADFLSGSRELAARAGARLLLSDEGGDDWRYRFAASDGATLLRDGSTFEIGNLRFAVLHTPGHTPEHLSFLITDTAASEWPMGVFTGDFVFVGDVGRPDLLEKAAGVGGTMERAARQLFQSLRKFRELPDYLQLWPGHGAGSACGKALGAVPQTTLGYEKLANWAFALDGEDEFVAAVLAGQPEPPRYFAEMKRLNRDGPPLLGARPGPERLPAERLATLLDTPERERPLVVDVRKGADYAARHVAGTINVPFGKSFTTWAGWLVPYDRDFYLVVDDAGGQSVADVVRALRMIGLDRVAGWLGRDAIEAWARAGREIGRVPQTTPADLAGALGRPGVHVVDVRARSEWEAGHMPGVPNVHAGHILDRLDELPRDGRLVLHCQSGSRSLIAASVLRARGFTNVENLAGGLGAWERAGYPVEREGALSNAG
ncbi:MAG: rhodanese-like domain-containing protein [Gemmatimonadaceae bacterium]